MSKPRRSQEAGKEKANSWFRVKGHGLRFEMFKPSKKFKIKRWIKTLE